MPAGDTEDVPEPQPSLGGCSCRKPHPSPWGWAQHHLPGPGPVSISLSGSSQGSRTQGSSSCLIQDKKSCAVIRASAPAGEDGDGDSAERGRILHRAGWGRQWLQKAASAVSVGQQVGARHSPGLTCAGVCRHPPLLRELLLPHEGHLLLDPGQDVGGGDQRLCSEGETWPAPGCSRLPRPRGQRASGCGTPGLRPHGMSPSHSSYGTSNTPKGAVGTGDRRTAHRDGRPRHSPWGWVTTAQPMGTGDCDTAHGL